MDWLKNLALKTYETLSPIVSKVGSTLSNIGSYVGSGNLAGVASSQPKVTQSTISGPQSTVSGPQSTVPKTTGPQSTQTYGNMTYAPNISTNYGIGQTQNNGSVMLLNEQGIPTGGYLDSNGVGSSKGPYELSQYRSALPSLTSKNMVDTRVSTSTQGVPYVDSSGQLVIPKAGFSGLSGEGGAGTSTVVQPTGLQGLAGSGGSAFTGLLGGTGGLASPSAVTSEETDQYGNKKKATYTISPILQQSNKLPLLPGVDIKNSIPSPFVPPSEQLNVSAKGTVDLGKVDQIKTAAKDIMTNVTTGDFQAFKENFEKIYNDTYTKVEAENPTPEQPIQFTPEQQALIDNSGDPFGAAQAMSNFMTSQTELVNLNKELISVKKQILASNESFQSITDDIKNNPDLPKGLALKRINEVQKAQKTRIDQLLGQADILNDQVKNQNEVVNRNFQIQKDAQTNNEQRRRDDQARFSMFAQYGLLGQMTNADINKFTQTLGLSVESLKQIKANAKDPNIKSQLVGSAETGYSLLLWNEKTGKTISNNKVMSGSGGSGVSGLGTFTGSSDPNVSWIGKAATTLANGIYSKDQRNNFINNITQAINRGDIDFAKNQVKSLAIDKLNAQEKSDYVLYENAQGIANVGSTLIKNGQVEFGPYKSAKEFLKPFFGQEKDQAYVQAKQAIELAQAQIRKGYYGTAVTSTEAGNAAQFLITDKDDGATVASKLQGYSQFLSWVNDATIARKLGAQAPDLSSYINTTSQSSGSSKTATGTQFTGASGKTYTLPY